MTKKKADPYGLDNTEQMDRLADRVSELQARTAVDKIEVTVTYPDGTTDQLTRNVPRSERDAGIRKMMGEFGRKARERDMDHAVILHATVKVSINGSEPVEG